LIVLDTDVIVWLLRGRYDVLTKFEVAVEETAGQLYITPVQIAEIFAGMRSNEIERTKKLINSLLVIELDREIGELAGEFINKYGKSHSVKIADALIAAATKVNRMKLWTFNEKHYPMMTEEEFFQ
jgi:predicted nucleic acid-binding protein